MTENRKTGRVEEEVTPNARQLEWLDKQEWTDRTDSRSWVREAVTNHKAEEEEEEEEEVREEGWQGRRGRVPPRNRHFHLRRRSWGIETAPYSRSSSSYNSLYLPLLNLKEKTWIWGDGEFLNGHMTRKRKEGKKERKRERIFKCVTWRQAEN